MVLLASASFLCAASALWVGRGAREKTARAGDPTAVAPAPPARLWLAHGEVDGTSTDVAVAVVDASRNVASLERVATLTHPPGSAIRGAVYGDVAFVVAKTEAPRNATYDSALYRVAGGAVRKLCDGVEGATAPWPTATGRVVVARGVEGAEPSPAEAQKLLLRTDELTLDEVDPATGAVRTLWRGQGYQAFLAARAGDELVVYFTRREGASLFALDPRSGQTRSLGAVAPFARDFSFDRVHGRVVFSDLAADGRAYEVRALELSSLATVALLAAPNEHLMPFALPTGDVAFSSEGDKGLAVLRAGGQAQLTSPLGDGSDAVTHAEGRWVALRHTPKVRPVDEPPRVVGYDVATGRVVGLDVPSSHFVEPLGFASAAAGNAALPGAAPGAGASVGGAP